MNQFESKKLIDNYSQLYCVISNRFVSMHVVAVAVAAIELRTRNVGRPLLLSLYSMFHLSIVNKIKIFKTKSDRHSEVRTEK